MTEDFIEINMKAKLSAGAVARNLSYLFLYCHSFTENINLNLFWFPKEILKHNHYEDVESWMEKNNYLVKKLNTPADIDIVHHIATNKRMPAIEIVGEEDLDTNMIRKLYTFPNKPMFKVDLQTQKNKICFWRYDKNRLTDHRDPNQYETWYKENTYTPDEWCKLYSFLNDNYNVVELEYRTPIREVFYHLSTCEFVVGYGGMWHILSDHLDNPMISILNPSRVMPNDHRLTYEYVCLPTIEQITDLDYFESLVYKAKKKTKLAQSGLTEWKLN